MFWCMIMLMTVYTYQLDMCCIKHHLIYRMRTGRLSANTKVAFRAIVAVLSIFITLHIVITSRSSFDGDNNYEWMRQNRDVRKYLMPSKNTTLIQPSSPDCNKNLKILLLVPSAPNNERMRQAVRKTWGHKVPEPDAKLLFFVGHDKNGVIKDSVLLEAQKYNDIIVEDFVDYYGNLTLKTLFMLKWTLQHCNRVPFILKADDDMLINIHRLLQVLINNFNPSNSLILGRIQEKAVPFRDPKTKWYLPYWAYADEFLPAFASGTAYVITGIALPELYTSALDTPLIPLEDVFLSGFVGNKKLGIPLINIDDIYNIKPLLSEHPCLYFPHLAVHEVAPENIEKLWTSLIKLKSKDCDSIYTKILKYVFGINRNEINETISW